MDFIWGENLRHRLAAVVSPVFNVDVASHPMLRRLSNCARVHREFALWSTIPESMLRRAALEDSIAAIHERGVVHRDMHLANVVVGAVTGRPYWIDFEGAVLRERTGWSTVVEEDRHRFRNSFGLIGRE
jgi:hypothetical protein